MNKVAIIIHGGAGPDSKEIRGHKAAYHASLHKIVSEAHAFLLTGASALDAVAFAVKLLENDPLFNAGRGAVLNCEGHVQMDAAIMDGRTRKAGAVAGVRHILNPVLGAKIILLNTEQILISGKSAEKIVERLGGEMAKESYFITPERRNEYHLKAVAEHHGTVGAVALDLSGHIAAATSTGGLSHAKPGRVSDSCLVGCGCYANDQTCAVSATGDGEFIIQEVLAHRVAMLIEFGGKKLQEACQLAIGLYAGVAADVGLIVVNSMGETGVAFNSERMHRASVDTTGKLEVHIYRDDH